MRELLANVFVDSLYEAVLDSLKVIPILFLSYLVVSFISHDHSHKFGKFLSNSRKTSVLYASFLGCVPQCGFSSIMADLYSQRRLSLGTLIAVFIATSDEAIPIMLSNPNFVVDLLVLIAIKILLAIIWGYLIDLCFLSWKQKKAAPVQEEHEHLHEHAHCGHIHTDECGHEQGGCCVNNVFIDAFNHTFSILVYIFIATFAINLILGFAGTEALSNLLSTNIYLQVVFAGLIGLIPNCASSVLLVELYIYGSLAFPALLAGLTSGAGVGLVILFTRNKKHPLKNLGILLLLYTIGVVSGLLMTLIPYFV